MSTWTSISCSVHTSVHACADVLITRVNGHPGLIIHDGGTSVVIIRFCPWCGTKLRRSPGTKDKHEGRIIDPS